MKTDKAVSRLLDYMNIYTNNTILYSSSDMILHIDSNASYFSVPHTHSRAAGYYFLSNASTSPNLPPTPPLNLTVLFAHFVDE